MKLAMMQPSFLPWAGYFELMLKSEIFIILDDFQFSAQSFHQRNRLYVTKSQVGWYTVPVKKKLSFKLPINQVQIIEGGNWQKKMLTRLKLNYSSKPYYSEIAPWVESWITTSYTSLSEFNTAFILYVSKMLNYRGDIWFSSDLKSTKVRSERVEELLRWSEAKEYYAARGSFDYMKEDGVFPLVDIPVYFQNFQAKNYLQTDSIEQFAPRLSVLDILLNIGANKTREYIENGTEKWLTWHEMNEALLKEQEEE